MDDGQVEELRKWALSLATASRPDLNAAAKAILLLTHDLRAARTRLVAYERKAYLTAPEIAEVEAQPDAECDRGSGLRARLSPPHQRGSGAP